MKIDLETLHIEKAMTAIGPIYRHEIACMPQVILDLVEELKAAREVVRWVKIFYPFSSVLKKYDETCK